MLSKDFFDFFGRNFQQIRIYRRVNILELILNKKSSAVRCFKIFKFPG